MTTETDAIIVQDFTESCLSKAQVEMTAITARHEQLDSPPQALVFSFLGKLL
jgi:hypothetical protein